MLCSVPVSSTPIIPKTERLSRFHAVWCLSQKGMVIIMKKYILILVVVFMLSSLVSCIPKGFKASDADIKLLEGIQASNMEKCKEAINSGAHIDQLVGKIGERTDNGAFEKNPLRIACFVRGTRIAKFLLEQGADPNAIDVEGLPVLCYVVKMGDIDLCNLMLKKGADINQKGKNGLMPLDSCFLQDNSGHPDSKRDFAVEKMYDFLISNGATLSSHVLDSAMKGYSDDGYCKYNLIQKIAKQLKSSGQKTGLSPLLESIILGDLTKFNSLVSDQKNIDPKVLLFASAFGNDETLQTLFKKGMDINSTDEDGNTLLAISAISGNINNIKYLMQKINLNRNKGLYTPLELAILNNQLDTTKFLIANGAKINSNISDTSKTDILSSACENGNLDIVKLLLENGYPKDGYNKALQTAAQNNQVEILQYLINAEFDVNSTFNEETTLGIASFWDNIDCIKLLISKGAKINGSKDLATPISKACFSGNTEVVKFLIENGADVNAQPADITGQLPIQQAIMSGSFDIVKLLIEHGAKIDDTIMSLAESSGSTNIYNYLKSVK